MALRDIAVTLVIFGLLPFILRRPQVGIFAWSWISYMNPHRLGWGFAYNMPFGLIVALVTIVSILFYKGPKRIPITGLTATWICLLLWMCITTIFAFTPYATVILEKVAKIQLFTFFTIMLIRTKRDLDILIWVITLSIGFYAFKGGLFTIQTLGEFRVWGPAGSFIADNNALAVATFMVLPMLYYLRQQTTSMWLKWVILVLMLLSVVSAIGSYSRSAFIAAGATGFFLWLKTPGKIVSGIIMAMVAFLVFNFMPEAWHTRMDTIINYEDDASAMNRITAWKVAINLASDRLVGGGFGFWNPQIFHIYGDVPADWDKSTAAHSIYFTMLGEHGWPGLILFGCILIGTWRLANNVIRESRDIPELHWQKNLLQLLQVSMIAYLSGGAFLNLAYFDLPWHIISFVIICKMILEDYKIKTSYNGLRETDQEPITEKNTDQPGWTYR